MADVAAVPMLVLARTQDFVAVINSTLRNAGLAVHCTWVRDNKALLDALPTSNNELLLAFTGPEPAEAASVVQLRNQHAPTLPVIFVREKIDEEIIASAMQLGARDVVTLASKGRLQAVVAREVRAYRAERELATYKNSARQTHAQMKAIIADTTDAIAFVQEGIVVDVNPAWLAAFGVKANDAMMGHPLMDFLDAATQSAFKAAMSACLQNKWEGQTLRANIARPDKTLAPLEFRLARGEYDGEPAVRFSIVAKQEERAAASAQPEAQPVAPPPAPTPQPAPAAETARDAGRDSGRDSRGSGRDTTTGFWQRKPFVDRLRATLAHPPKAGVREMIALEPDQLNAICDQLGPAVIEDFVAQLAAVLSEHFKQGDLVARCGDGNIVALVERGTTRDVDALLQSVLGKVAAHAFHVGGKSVICTLSAGVCLVDSRATDPIAPMSDVLRALHEAQAQGGNRVRSIDRADEDTKQQANDAIWVRMIKGALMDNRFKLMQQPIASLLGAERGMFDVLVRMIDEQGSDVLPAEFMAAAERNDLMKNIDRWIISNSMAFCGSRQVQRLFVRVSRDSARDKSLAPWLLLQLKSTRINPAQIAFQVSEAVANEYLADVVALATAVRQAGFKFALEHFGSSRDPARLLSHLSIDYLKIDGALMQSLAVDTELQQRVKEFVDTARTRKIATIAERVEDANTMAVLWQLGVEYIQGYFINEPEQVVMG